MTEQDDDTDPVLSTTTTTNTTATTTTTATTNAPEPRTWGELKASFQNFGTSAHELVAARVQTFRAADDGAAPTTAGPHDDVLAATLPDALERLQELVVSAKSVQQKRPQRWNFATAPLQALDKTLDDLFRVFLVWARVEQPTTRSRTAKDDDEEEEAYPYEYNVSKAFRRLEGYATWMDNTGRDLIDPPLTTDSLQDAFEAWNMTVSTDKEGRLVWWMDFAAMDAGRVKDLSSADTLRLFVWFTHYLLFHSNTAGMVIVQNLANVSFWKLTTWMPPQLGMKIDRFTIGVLPIQMKHYYLTDAPWWTKAIVKMTKALLSKKMRARLSVVDEAGAVLEPALGLECIPKSFPGCAGQLATNMVADQYFVGVQ